MSLQQYRSLGRSGLVISPLALGTMTFGMARWGMDKSKASEVFNAYVDAGGNFIDTADVYSGGVSEEMLGDMISARGLREQVVVATKSGFSAGAHPHGGGNGSKHVVSALEASMRRLKTDYIDLYWAHVWDSVTPPEELLATMSNLVRSGKVRYWGLSNAPAWYVAKISGLAQAHGLSGPIAMQYFYSLVNRDVEDEHVPLGLDSGIGIVPWSPLAFGLLTGKYDRAAVAARGKLSGGLPTGAAGPNEVRPDNDKRLDGSNPFGDSLFTERNWKIVETVKMVAAEASITPADVALAWVVSRRGVSSTLIGVSNLSQLQSNILALEVKLSEHHLALLDTATADNSRMLYSLFGAVTRKHAVFGGNDVQPWR